MCLLPSDQPFAQSSEWTLRVSGGRHCGGAWGLTGLSSLSLPSLLAIISQVLCISEVPGSDVFQYHPLRLYHELSFKLNPLLVCSSGHNKIPQTCWPKQWEFMFSHFWRVQGLAGSVSDKSVLTGLQRHMRAEGSGGTLWCLFLGCRSCWIKAPPFL